MKRGIINMEWIDIKGFEGFYQINKKGLVKSLDRYITDSLNRTRLYNGKTIKPFINESGYLQIHLSYNGKSLYPYVHKLIAESFIPNPNNFEEVNHIDHDKLNNDISNLEWCNRSYNMIKCAEFYGNRKEDGKCVDCNLKIGRESIRCKSCNAKINNPSRKVDLSAKPSKEELLELIKTKSFLEIGRDYNVSDNAIRKWCKNYNLPHRKKDLNNLYI